MADFPGSFANPAGIISTADQKQSPVGQTTSAFSAAATWPAANRALYCPVLVESVCVAQQMAVIVGVQSGNLDIGIYNEAGAQLVHAGSTAVGAAGVQVVNITDTTLTPGVYFLALNCDNTTATFNKTSTGAAGAYSALGIQQQAVGAIALPATATFANPAAAYAPLIMASTLQATI